MQRALAFVGDGRTDQLGRASRYRLKSGREVVASLKSAIALHPSHGSVLAAKVSAALIESCCDNSNAWVGTDLHNSGGDLFDSAGSLTSCGERLCPNCLRRRSAASRKRAREGVEVASSALAGLPGLRWRFVTLSFPTIPANDLPLVKTISLIQSSWRKLSRSQWWKDNVRAVVKGVEFTLGDEKRTSVDSWSPDRDGYHTHIHLLICSHWLNARQLSFQWTAAIKFEIARRGLIAPRGTREGRYFADIREVKDQVNKPGFTSLDRAVLEVGKYLTKCTSWSRLPSAQLLDMAAIVRWPRMFELGGACRAPIDWAARDERRRQKEWVESQAALHGDYFDREGFLRASEWCKSAEDRAATYEAFLRHAARLESQRPQTLFDLTSIYTKALFVSDSSRGSPVESDKPRVTIKSKGLALLRDGKEQEFRAMLSNYLHDNREFRLRQLRRKYPFAEFWIIALNERNTKRCLLTESNLSET